MISKAIYILRLGVSVFPSAVEDVVELGAIGAIKDPRK
jgi:hypothetical protein